MNRDNNNLFLGSSTNLIVLTSLKGSSVTYPTWAAFAIPLVWLNMIVAFFWLMSLDKMSMAFGWFPPDDSKVELYEYELQIGRAHV